jgi:hypothetical protein
MGADNNLLLFNNQSCFLFLKKFSKSEGEDYFIVNKAKPSLEKLSDRSQEARSL